MMLKRMSRNFSLYRVEIRRGGGVRGIRMRPNDKYTSVRMMTNYQLHSSNQSYVIFFRTQIGDANDPRTLAARQIECIGTCSQRCADHIRNVPNLIRPDCESNSAPLGQLTIHRNSASDLSYDEPMGPGASIFKSNAAKVGVPDHDRLRRERRG